MGRRPSVREPEIDEADDSIIMSVRLRSGRFESSIEVPLFASKQEREAFVDQWLLLMEAGLKVGSAHRAAKQAGGGDA